MLSMLRGAMGGWIAKIFLALLVLSFAVWGISGSMFQGVGNSVITVGQTNVGLLEYRLAYDRQLNLLSRQFGTRLTREQAQALGLDQTVLSQMVSGAVMDETARRMGLGMSDDRLAGIIGRDEAFQDASGQFSRSQLRAVLNSIGMPEDQYVETRRDVAVRQQIISATAEATEMPDAFADFLATYQGEKRRFDYTVVTPADIEAIADPLVTEDGKATLESFYEENKADYVAPEYRRLYIVKLEASDIADPAVIDPTTVREDYEARKDQFSEPERRTVQQLVFPDSDSAEAAASKLAGDMSFDALVEEEGKTLEDVSLGTLTKTQIPDPAVADVAFSLDEGATSDPVKGLFGTVILRVTHVQEGSTKPLTEVEGEIRQALALEAAANEIYDTHDRLEDERAAGLSLSEAASAVGLTPRAIDAIDRQARDAEGNVINDIPQSRDLLTEAFETDPGVETDPLQIGTEGFVWFEVEEVTPERQKGFDEVIEQVRNDWLAEQTSEAVSSLAQTIRERIAGEESFNTVLADLFPPKEEEELQRIAQQSVALTRDATTNELPSAAVEAGFSEPLDAVFVADGVEDQSRIVMKVANISDEKAEDLPPDAIQNLNASLSDDLITQMIAQMRNDLKVEINQDAIRAALAR